VAKFGTEGGQLWYLPPPPPPFRPYSRAAAGLKCCESIVRGSRTDGGPFWPFAREDSGRELPSIIRLVALVPYSRTLAVDAALLAATVSLRLAITDAIRRMALAPKVTVCEGVIGFREAVQPVVIPAVFAAVDPSAVLREPSATQLTQCPAF